MTKQLSDQSLSNQQLMLKDVNECWCLWQTKPVTMICSLSNSSLHTVLKLTQSSLSPFLPSTFQVVNNTAVT